MKIDSKVLQNYAKVLVNFALHNGQGVKENEVVMVRGNIISQELLLEIHNQILRSKAHPLVFLQPPDKWQGDFFKNAQNDEQISFFPKNYYKALVDTVDHNITIIADDEPQILKKANPQKVILKQQYRSYIRRWFDQKEQENKFSWTLASYGTKQMAQEANLTQQKYWNQIIKACFLDQPDPIKNWSEVNQELEKTRKWLNQLNITSLHVESEKNDITIGIGKNRQWLGGRGNNIPSFELFISPDWRQTQGTMTFDQPLYRYGNIIRDITFSFKDGLLTDHTAQENNELLTQIVNQPNANKVGEFSLTDKRYSRIDHFMAETLYDENYGGQFGNTHIAIGSSYKDSFTGKNPPTTPQKWQEIGFNTSPEHLDFVSTEDRQVTATLADGSKKIIYKDGMFTR